MNEHERFGRFHAFDLQDRATLGRALAWFIQACKAEPGSDEDKPYLVTAVALAKELDIQPRPNRREVILNDKDRLTRPPSARCWCGWFPLDECKKFCNDEHLGESTLDRDYQASIP